MLSDREIIHYAERHGMITPFSRDQVRLLDNGAKAISHGTSSYGYDIRIADDPDELAIVVPPRTRDWLHTPQLNPKKGNHVLFRKPPIIEDESGRYILIPPNSFALGRTVEQFNIPRNMLTICIGKSTYARIGTIPHITPFEPEWRGHATLEISNTAPLPSRLYLGEGIAQLIFFRGDTSCLTSYADRQGKYQDQPAKIVMAAV